MNMAGILEKKGNQVEIKGHLDSWGEGEISGWLWNPAAPDEEIDFQLIANGTVLATVKADIFRPDLQAAGLGSGRHGFRIDMNTTVGFQSQDGTSLKVGETVIPISSFISENSRLRNEHASAESVTVCFFPDYSATNYYQVGLYGNPGSTRVRPGTIHEALELQTSPASDERVVFHLHWTTPILAPSLHEGDARARKENFVSALRAFIRRGGVFYWTIHNLYPHDTKFFEVEQELCRELASLAARILVHNRASIPLVAKNYSALESKIELFPHGNYEPIIECENREAARSRIREKYGIGDGDFVFSLLGQLRPYKGIDDLITSFLALHRRYPERRLWLLIAGKPVLPTKPGSYTRIARALPNVVVNETFLDNADFNDHLFASDVIVCPYRNILTSGSILHAMSAGVPVVAPDIPQIAEIVESGSNGQLFGNGTSLAQALERSMQTVESGEMTAERCTASVADLRWPDISRRFFELVNSSPGFKWIEEEVGPRMRVREVDRGSDTLCIVVNYEHIEDISRLVSSLHDQSPMPDVLIVDSGSPGLHERAFMQLPPSIGVVRTGRNVGYAAAVNIGIAHARRRGYDYVCVLNPDMVAFPDSIAVLREHVSRGGDVLASGLIYHDLKRTSVWFSGGNVQLAGMLRVGHDTDEFSGVRKTEYLSGACIFGSLEVIERVGRWPEEYFLYFEETDWCQRAKELGIRLEVVADAKFSHIKRSAFGGLPQPYYLYYYVRNALIFASRHSATPLTAHLQQLQANFITPWLERVASKNPSLSESARRLTERGIADGLSGRLGPAEGVAWSGLGQLSQTVGHLDTVTAGNVRGWVTGNHDCLIRMLWNGQSRGVFVAGQESADMPVLAEGKARRFCLPLPATAGHVELQRWPQGDLLFNGSTAVKPAAEELVGRTDGVRTGRLIGWVADKGNGRSVNADIIIDGVLYCTVPCNKFRRDLLHSGVRDGYAAFDVLLDEEILSRERIDVEIRLTGSRKIIDKRIVNIHTSIAPADEILGLTDFLRRSAHNIEINAETKGFYAIRHGLLADITAATIFRARREPSSTKVSVVMPAYNRESTILRSVDSVLAQTHENWELLIVDDGSVDDTVAAVEAFVSRLDSRFRQRISVIRLDRNRGVSAARNKGLVHATGEFIAYLDSDNTWSPAYLATMLHAMESTGRLAAYCGQDIYYSDGNKELLYASRMHPFCQAALESRNFIDLNAFMHARSNASGKPVMFNTDLRRLVDWEFIIRVSRDTPPLLVPAFLSRYDFDKAPNQITATEDFSGNVAHVRRSVGLDFPTDVCTGTTFDLDIVSCIPDEQNGTYALEQFGYAGQSFKVHPDAQTSFPEGRDGLPTLVLFHATRFTPESLALLHRHATAATAMATTGRLLADAIAGKQAGLCQFATVLDCDLNWLALADAFDDVSLRTAAHRLTARCTAEVGYAMLAPGVWGQVLATSRSRGIGIRQALDLLTRSASDIGAIGVLYDPSVIGFDIA